MSVSGSTPQTGTNKKIKKGEEIYMTYFKFNFTDEAKQVEKFTSNDASVVKSYYNTAYYNACKTLQSGDKLLEITKVEEILMITQYKINITKGSLAEGFIVLDQNNKAKFSALIIE